MLYRDLQNIIPELGAAKKNPRTPQNIQNVRWISSPTRTSSESDSFVNTSVLWRNEAHLKILSAPELDVLFHANHSTA